MKLPRLRRNGGSGRSRAGLVVNAVIVLALLLVALVTFRAVHSGSASADTTQQTTKVDTGTVQATVSASGNVEAATTTDATFEGDGGIVTKIYVKAGDKVTQGQPLAMVDQTDAQQSLETARAQLTAAQASYSTTAEGQTSAEAAQDTSSVASAQQSVASAYLSLHQSGASYELTRKQENAKLAQAQRAVAAASTAADKATAQEALTEVENSRASTLLQARQQIASQQQMVKSAQLQLTSAKNSAAANAEGPTDAELASASASVTQARISVAQAQKTLEETVLKAPVAGTVSSVNGSVGESSSGGSTSSSSDSSSTSTTTSSSSGFVTLTSAGVLEVTADVAEADITDVAVGQAATITLSATDAEVTGTVTHVDTESTVTNNVVEYGVTVRLDKARGVRLGATAQMTITTGEKDDVTRVSTSALTTVGNTTTATVLASDGTTKTVQVTTGLAGDTDTQVVSGLDIGDTVVIPETDSTSSTGLTFPGAGGGGPGVGGGVGGP